MAPTLQGWRWERGWDGGGWDGGRGGGGRGWDFLKKMRVVQWVVKGHFFLNIHMSAFLCEALYPVYLALKKAT